MPQNTGLRTLSILAIALVMWQATPAHSQKNTGVPAQVWSLQGNSDTDPALAFLGTTDSTELRIGTNGTLSLLIKADGGIEIGSEEDSVGLKIYGDLLVTGLVTGWGGSHFGGLTDYQEVDSDGLLQFYGNGNYGVGSGRYVFQTLNGGALTGIGLRNAVSGDKLELINGSSTTVLSADYATGDLATLGDATIGGRADVTDSLVAGNARIIGTLGVGGPNSDPAKYSLFVNGRLRSNGINELSDRRMKRNIRGIEGALESVLAMRGVEYEWRKDEYPSLNLPAGKQIGLIAQEVEEVVPEVVETDVEGVKSVEYAHLVAVLIEAVKEQQQLIDRQSQEIAAVRSELGALRELATTE